MHEEKQLNNTFFSYLFLLMVVVIFNLIYNASIIDIVYFAVVIGCLIRYLLIIKRK